MWRKRFLRRAALTPLMFVGGTGVWLFCKLFDRFGTMQPYWSMIGDIVSIVWTDPPEDL